MGEHWGWMAQNWEKVRITWGKVRIVWENHGGPQKTLEKPMLSPSHTSHGKVDMLLDV